MAYSESLFLLTAILALYGIERQWPLLMITLIVGLSTATRPVAVALLAPLVLHIWATSETWKAWLLKLVAFLPLGCWGIAGYMFFQWLAFDDPLAFARTQAHWRTRPAVGLSEQTLSLITFEPIWSVYVPSSPCFWKNHEADVNPLFSMQLLNPIYFVGTVLLIILGGMNRWLSGNEIVLSAGLLLIPYVTRSHEMCMVSMGRFAAVVFPVYLVVGQILARIPAPVAALVLALGGFWMGIYAALFAAWYRVF